MGLLADFFIATEEDAGRYDGEASFPESHRAQYKGITEIELSTLFTIAQGKPVDDNDPTTHECRMVSVLDGGERVTVEVIPELVTRLARASDQEVKTWAALWGATAELDCDGDELMPLLLDLRRLAGLAATESRAMYLWNCV